jgi:hypothetical protein
MRQTGIVSTVGTRLQLHVSTPKTREALITLYPEAKEENMSEETLSFVAGNATKLKATPGPWRVDIDDQDGCIGYYLENTQGAEGPDEAEANARLIAAAPELLEACEACMEEFNDRYDGAPDGGYRWMGELMYRLTMALERAKATTLSSPPQLPVSS